MQLCVHLGPYLFISSAKFSYQRYDVMRDFCDYAESKWPNIKAHVIVPKWDNKK